ncbi:serine acetyltransferase [Methylophaga sp. 42_25_T18]|nr:serine acetyltransferase [Methylophaga sp. 42_25_T18]
MDIIVLGASGHAKVVIDLIEKQGQFLIAGLIDDNPALSGQDICNYKVLGNTEELKFQNVKQCVVAIGDNRVRNDVEHWLTMNGFSLAKAIIHPSVQLAQGVSIGDGSVAMAGSVVNSDTVIANNTIINTGATIDHDCTIGNAVHIAPGSTICGGVSVGDLTLIGAGAVICPNVKIGKNVIVGAGATVLQNVADNVSVVGTPAKVIS